MLNNLQKSLTRDMTTRPWERDVKFWPWLELLPAKNKLKKLSIDKFTASIDNYSELQQQGLKVVNLSESNLVIQNRISRQLSKTFTKTKKINLYQLSRAKSHIVVSVPKDVTMTIDYKNPIFSYWANVYFVTGSNSKVTIIDRHQSSVNYFGAGSVYIFSGKSSVVDHLTISDNLPSYHFQNKAFPGRESHCSFNLTGELSDNYYHFTLHIDHQSSQSNGIITAAANFYNKSKSVLELINNHQSSDTDGDITFRGLGQDSSWAKIDGLIKIGTRAIDTNSYLQEDILLLSDDSQVKAEPNLEILNNEVKASHGATLGNIDSKALFYLMSRGLSKAQAEKLIVSGFLNGVIAKIDNQFLASEFQKFLN